MHNKRIICMGLSLVMTATALLGCGGSTGAATASEPQAAEAQTEGAEAAEENAEAADAAGAQDEAPEGTAADNTAAAAAGEEIAPEDISVTWEDSHVYGGLTLGRYDTVTTYGVKGYEDVPFIRVSDYMNFICDGKQRSVMENGVMRISINGAEITIDPAADTITIDEPAKYRSSGFIDGAIVDKEEYNIVTPSVKNKSSQTDAAPMTVSLKEYHMPVVAYEDDILMPFLALQNSLGSIRQCNFWGYNGKDYYNIFLADKFTSDVEHAASKESPYYKAIYSGPFSEKSETTQAYADYGYYSICLLLDLTFGHKEEKNITTFDEYFTRLNAKKSMCSIDPGAALTSEVVLFNYLFDSGHDTMFSYDTVFGKVDPDQAAVGELAEDIKNSEEGEGLFDQASDTAAAVQEDPEASPYDVIMGALLEKGFNIPEVAPLLAWDLFFGKMKPKDYGTRRLDYAGDTAVIYFESFEDDSTTRNPSYYLDAPNEDDDATSNFAFFYHCFEDIKQHNEVKNVVINLATNGGGAATGLVTILGFLSEDGEVTITDRDLVAGNYREECYHVDTNLDGIADDQDGYGGQYDFYIMCSGTSYSCANALPYFAQQEGLAKIIGTNPGGGDCVVATFIDAYGRCGVCSGFLKLGKEEVNGFVSDEKATTVDLNMMPSLLDVANVPWFDAEGIADAVHQYQDGATEITYGDKGEMVADILGLLFEQMAGAAEESMEGGTGAGAEVTAPAE